MNFIEKLGACQLIGIVRGSDADAALRTVLTLAEEGLELVEVSLTTPHAFDVISRARSVLGPDAALGAGTVLTVVDLCRAVDAGASFAVTPAFTPAVPAAGYAGLPIVAGVFTPTEVVVALDNGATAVKLFPASLGGVAYLRALRDALPDVPFVPVGGVDAESAHAYLAAGAVAVGVGSPLVGDAASGGSMEALRYRVRRFLAGIA